MFKVRFQGGSFTDKNLFVYLKKRKEERKKMKSEMKSIFHYRRHEKISAILLAHENIVLTASAFYNSNTLTEAENILVNGNIVSKISHCMKCVQIRS